MNSLANRGVLLLEFLVAKGSINDHDVLIPMLKHFMIERSDRQVLLFGKGCARQLGIERLTDRHNQK